MTDSSEEDGRTLTPDLLPVGIRVSKFEAEPGFVSGEVKQERERTFYHCDLPSWRLKIGSRRYEFLSDFFRFPSVPKKLVCGILLVSLS
jgi:hypothetical protein